MMLLALVLFVLGVTTAKAQKVYKAEIDPSYFKAWTSNEPGATVVENPDPVIDVDSEGNETVNNFRCDNNLYKDLGDWSGIYGSAIAYYLWYADLAGTQKMYFYGTPNLKFWVQFNREAPEEGAADQHGGAMQQQELTIGEDGVAVYDCSSLEYLHLNCIKTKGGSGGGRLTRIIIEGTIKPTFGFLDLISNGDAEGTDLESFPVSHDGPHNGNTANDRPEIVEGGVDGSKCLKVVSDDVTPDEGGTLQTWSTQFFLKTDEPLMPGDKWTISMWVKADRDATIATSAQGAPRAWHSGFIDAFNVTTEWKKFNFSGEITNDQGKDGGLQSVAFDLNNDVTSNVFYFDNIVFQKDLGGNNPMNQVTGGVFSDAIQITLADVTNLKDLVKATGKDRLIFPNETASVKWNGKTANIISVEGREDGNLYVFLLDDGGDSETGTEFNADNATVTVSFKNPTDAAHQILFTTGKWEGDPLMEFSGMVCEYRPEIEDTEYYSYLWGAPAVQSADPEEGSFNLPTDTKKFVITFNQEVNVSSVVANLDGEKLVASGDGDFATVITLTRTGSSALAGEKELVITAAEGEREVAKLEEEIIIKYSFGPLQFDENDQPETIVDDQLFAETSANHIPAGYIVNFNGDERTSEGDYSGGGPRMFDFAGGGDFTKGLYYREGYVTYGTVEGYPVTLKAGKTYTISFTSAMWKDNGSQQTFQVLTEDEEEVLSETITNTPNVNGNTSAAVTGATQTEIEFTPEADGNYILKWSVGGYNEVLIANVSMKHEPSTLGYKETTLLTAALDKAKAARDDNNGERYDGLAFTTLDETIKKVEADKDGYTSPTVYTNAIAELEAVAKAMTDHRALCDEYDKQIKASLDVERQNAANKFAGTETYANLKAVNAKYHGSSEWRNVSEDPEVEDNQLFYTFDVLKDDAELKAAAKEISNIATLAGLFFTEGISAPENSEGGKGTGAAVLTDRIRQGVEALKALGVAEDDAYIVEGNNALTDDDALADAIKNKIKYEMFNQLKNADNDLFAPVVDEETLEETTKSYNMTVFVKNPNIYKQQTNMDFTEENVPGWVTPEDYSKPGLTVGWGSPKNVEGVAEDCMFQTWGGAYRAENTVTDLPAGVYTLKAAFGERDNATLDETGVYVRTSSTAEGEFDQISECPSIGQAFPSIKNFNVVLTDIEVTDGTLVIGINAQAGTHTFFNGLELWMTGAIAGHDYSKDFEEVATGVESAKAAKVRSLELFDLNGRRITTARKGLVIVKKTMSDGTVKTEKVIK